MSCRVAIAMGALFASCWGAPAPAADRITAAVALFDGPEALGQSVSTIIRLQLWGTLRVSSEAKRVDDVDSGAVIWAHDRLSSPTFESAERFAKSLRILAQLVLFGKVYPYARDAVVHSYLGIPEYKDFRQNRNEIWRIAITSKTGPVVFSSDIPQRRYAFAPTVIEGDVVEKYKGRDSVKLFSAPANGTPVGVVGDNTRLLEVRSNAVRVRSGKVTGWVPTSDIERSSDALEFTSGLIRLFRGDWSDAFVHFKNVRESNIAPNDVRVDAILYQALAWEKQDRDASELLREAKDLNPLAKRTARYIIMAEVAKLARVDQRSSAAARRVALQHAETAVEEYSSLFEVNDAWLSQVRLGLQKLRTDF
jgi:hypothetical protein